MESIILLALLVVLILLGSPIGFTLILLPTVYVLITDAAPLTLIPFKMFDAIDSVPLTAIPFFMLTGELMTSATITDRLVELSRRLIGRMRGKRFVVLAGEERVVYDADLSSVADEPSKHARKSSQPEEAV